MKDKYTIKEVWEMTEGTENYECSRANLKQVKDYILDWVDSWKENAKESGYKFLGSKTDNKTFANLRIKTDYGTDYFYLKVTNNK